MVEEADVQETTKLLEVISVTDSEVSTTGGGGVVSPSDVSTGGQGLLRKGYTDSVNISLDLQP